MEAENNETDKVSDSKVKFELVNDGENEEFPEPESEKKIIDAEILRETKTAPTVLIEQPAKDLDPITALLSNLDTGKEVQIIVKRQPDKQYKNSFRISCDVEKNIETMSWDGEPLPNRHYEYIKKKYGGGYYRFQLWYDGGFKQSWKEVLSDPAELSEAEITAKSAEAKIYEQPRISDTSQPFANQFPQEKQDLFGDFIKQFQQFKQLQDLFTPPAAPIATPPPANDEPRVTKETIKMALIEKALDNPVLLGKALEAVFDIAPDKNPRPVGFWEGIASSFATNPAVSEMLLNGLSSVAAPLANLALAKLTPTPGAAAPPPPPQIILRRPAANQTPPVQQPNAPTAAPAEVPPIQSNISEPPPIEQNQLPTVPLITLK